MTAPATRRFTTGRTLISPQLFDRLVNRIVKEHLVDQAMAVRIADQALAFLGACAVTGKPLSPSVTVDIGWHAFLMYTAEYAEFCQRVAGRFIHHVPEDGEGEQEAKDAQPEGRAHRVLEETAEAIRVAGYAVDSELWLCRGKCTGGNSPCRPGACTSCHDQKR